MMAKSDKPLETPALFSNLVMGLASAALIEMGVVEDPSTAKKRLRKEQARQHIDMLSMLQEKTRGNLSDDEKLLIDRAITDLKLQFAKLA
jgi:hypothetical protein